MPSIPLRWKDSQDDSPRDISGHGTYTSSIAADNDVLAAMDQAIADGVNIMLLSLGSESTSYFQDVIAIASLSAIEKKILVVCAVGNDRAPNSTHNVALCITTVGAGTLDRSFIAIVILRNNLTLVGKSEFPNPVIIRDTPLYNGKGYLNKTMCNYRALNESEMFGKVVICDYDNSNKLSFYYQAQELARVGALAAVADEAKVKIMRFVLTSFGTKPAPQIVEFSSKGLDSINSNILNPDMIAPRDQVLAAFSPLVPIIGTGNNYVLTLDYALLSGTSMSAPHVVGVAALLKVVHPEWIPAPIRLVMMTTADTIDNNGTTLKNQKTGLLGTPLDYGVGHVNLNKAVEKSK
ncbi:hypothetical protein PTKIN_Ptkin09bG0137100 [Pterospermum kingtungense]